MCDDGCHLVECDPGFVDVDGEADNGCECQRSHAGEEVCDARDNDCDGAVDEDVDLQSDLNHCGACDVFCRADAGRVGCVAGACVVFACEDGFHDLDDSGVNGCEYVCEPTADEVEHCDGVDEDCDGAVDEDFDRASDPLNCGLCGNNCADEALVTACLDGRCESLGCADGHFGADCADLEPVTMLYVDARLEESGDGSVNGPVLTVQEALALADELEGRVVVEVAAEDPPAVTDYEGPFELSRDHLTLRGAHRDSTRLLGAVEITGSHTRLERVRIEPPPGDADAVRLACEEGCELVEARVRAIGLDGPDPPDFHAVSVAGGRDVRVVGVRIEETRAGRVAPQMDPLRRGSHTFGIYAVDSLRLVLLHNEVHEVHGGQAEDCGVRVGGTAYGILVGNSPSATLRGNRVLDLQGGAGSDRPGEGRSCPSIGRAGNVIGIQLGGAPEANLVGNEVRRLVGGRWGRDCCNNPVPGGGYVYGVYISGSDNVTSTGDLVHGLRGERRVGVEVSAASVIFRNLTVGGLNAGGRADDDRQLGHGVYAQPDGTLTLIDSLVVGAHFGVNGGWAPAAQIHMHHSLAFGTTDGAWRRVTDDGDNLLQVDPQFDEDQRPLPGSPVIDAGDPDSPCEMEAGVPEDCRIDMGHTGGTTEGRATR